MNYRVGPSTRLLLSLFLSRRPCCLTTIAKFIFFMNEAGILLSFSLKQKRKRKKCSLSVGPNLLNPQFFFLVFLYLLVLP